MCRDADSHRETPHHKHNQDWMTNNKTIISSAGNKVLLLVYYQTPSTGKATKLGRCCRRTQSKFLPTSALHNLLTDVAPLASRASRRRESKKCGWNVLSGLWGEPALPPGQPAFPSRPLWRKTCWCWPGKRRHWRGCSLWITGQTGEEED